MRRSIAVAFGMGTNLGDRLESLRFAVRRLNAITTDLSVSSIYRSAPHDLAEQPEFLNACCVGRATLAPRELLAELRAIEQDAGRVRTGPRFGPRVLDLDLLLYGEQVVEERDLVVPHPRMRQRAFVLIPLQEIAADWKVPGGRHRPNATVRELAEAVSAEGVERFEKQLESSA